MSALFFCAALLSSHALASLSSDIERANVALEEWQLSDARAVAEHWLPREPKNGEVLALAARVQFHRGEYAAATALYAAAVEAGHAADPGTLSVMMATQKLTAGYLERESQHFRVAFPAGKDAIVAERSLVVLEAAYRRIALDLGLVPDESDKIAVLIVPDASGLAAVSTLLPVEIERSGTIAICKFNRLMITSPLATYQGYDWADTLAHEYVHLVINLVSRARVPIWLHEGIAKFTETRWNGEAGRSLTPASVNLLSKAAQKDAFIPFERMHPSMAKLPSQEDSGLAFAEVFVAIDMLQSKRGFGTLKNVLADIGSGTDVQAAVARGYGSSFAVFLKDWKTRLLAFKNRFIAGAKQTAVELKKAGRVRAEDDALEPIAEKSARDFSRLGELLHVKGHVQAATVEYAKAYQIAGTRYPSLLFKYAKALMAAAPSASAADATNLQNRAAAVLRDLLSVHPNEGSAHLLLAQLTQTTNTAAARDHYLAAMYQNPYNPVVFAGLEALAESPDDRAAAARHKAWASGENLPQAAAVPSGALRLSILCAPFGRTRFANGTTAAYPAVGLPFDDAINEIELLPRLGRSQTARLETVSPSARRAICPTTATTPEEQDTP